MSAKTTIIGRIQFISDVESLGQNGFQKRYVVIDDTRVKDGKTYPCFYKVDFTGARMAMLDNFSTTQLVQIEGLVEGREYQGRYYHDLRGMSIAPYQYQQPQPQQYQPQPQNCQQGMPPQTYSQQMPYGQPFGRQTASQNVGQSISGNPYSSQPADDGLPF